MIIDGKAYLTGDRMCELLGWEDCNWSMPVRKQKIAHVRFKKVGRENYFLQADVYALLEELEAKSRLLCDVQALAMYIIDSCNMEKTRVAELLGFHGKNKLAIMNTWLKNTIYTKTVARVLVCAKKNFPHYLEQFDKEYAA